MIKEESWLGRAVSFLRALNEGPLPLPVPFSGIKSFLAIRRKPLPQFNIRKGRTYTKKHIFSRKKKSRY